MLNTEVRLKFLNQLNSIFQRVFDDKNLQITEDSSARTLEEWDSLIHVTLVIAIEEEFKVRLNPTEVGRLRDVGAMIDFLLVKTEKAQQSLQR